ncbi:Bardet-Biedl syndrome 10 protein isoform X2 [Tyto alba]|uniref:Bardet-Biedl syndrome 10 protein isoform X2 n=1 Tax=Tyto alba TaxID=56313 RepID=UPI001C6734C0|nr:Bardet-Biedl syndrome 10 protein isoform X2 [Tyto alba]
MSRRREPGRLCQEAAALAGAVRGALGPRGGRALLVRPTGQAVLTRDGRRLLEALSLEPPTARDFAAYCPAGGDLRAVLVTQPLRAALPGPGGEFVVDSEGRCQAALSWIAGRTEALMQRFRSSNVKLLLSSVKQDEDVIYYAKLYGVSVVECLSSEEMALISEITGVSPCAPFADDTHGKITETAVATFCQPLLLGSKRCAHIGFTSVCAFQPHCLILCGPVDSVNEQHAAALQGAFTMLQQLFKSVDRRVECKAESESQNGASDVCHWRSSAAQKQFAIETIFCNSDWASERQLKARGDETETQTVDLDLQGSENPPCVQTDLQIPSNPISHIKEFSITTDGDGSSGGTEKPPAKCEHPGDVQENYVGDSPVDSQKSYSTAVLAAHNADRGIACERGDVGKDLEKTSCSVVPCKHENTSCASVAQNCSSSLIEAGSVLPVGGYFEILLHYYIQYYAKQLQETEVTVVANVVADALLSIPKCLYSTTERNGFTKFYLKTINALRKNQPLPVNEKGLESVYCKYQLVISVLHCVAELLSIDLIIGIKRPLQKIEDYDSEDDF